MVPFDADLGTISLRARSVSSRQVRWQPTEQPDHADAARRPGRGHYADVSRERLHPSIFWTGVCPNPGECVAEPAAALQGRPGIGRGPAALFPGGPGSLPSNRFQRGRS